MKAVNIKLSKGTYLKNIKFILLAVIIYFIFTLAITAALSAILLFSGSLFKDFSQYLMLLPLIASGLISGYILGRMCKLNGMILGSITGFVVFLIIVICGLCINSEISYFIILKLICTTIPCAAGAVKGVNNKTKFKI